MLKFESLREKYFTEENHLLIDLMASVIATVILNSRQGEKRIGSILQQMGTLSAPAQASQKVLRQHAEDKDSVVVNQLAFALAKGLGKHTDRIPAEAQRIFDGRLRLDPQVRPDLYERIASWGAYLKHEQIHWQFGLYGAIWRAKANTLTEWSELADISAPWLRLRESVNRWKDFAHEARSLASALAERAGFPHDAGDMDASQTWFQMQADATPLFGEQVKNVTFLFQRQGGLDELNANRLAVILTDGTAFSTFVIVQWLMAVPERLQQNLKLALSERQIGVAFLTLDDVFQLLEPLNSTDQFRRHILRHAVIASPFTTRGPVYDKQFYGREDEIKTLTHNSANRSYAVVGNRRIGKTSLLLCAAAIMAKDGKVMPLPINCMDVRGTDDFYDRFADETKGRFVDRSPRGFADAMRKLRSSGRTPVLLIDEVDRLLDKDLNSGAPLVSTWRALATDGICQFVFFGSARLAQLLNNAASDMSNFPEPLHLGYFPKDIAGRVLIDPLERLAVYIADKKSVIDLLYELTSGHPSLVQLIGKLLIESRTVKQDRYVDCAGLSLIGRSTQFRETYLDIVWGEVGPNAEGVNRKSLAVERLITLLELGNGFHLEELVAALGRYGIAVQQRETAAFERNGLQQLIIDYRRLHNALRILKLLSILGEEKLGVYHYVPSAFPAFRKLYPTAALEEYIQEAIKDLR